MGCFDYTCECLKRGGYDTSTCNHEGGQYQDATVIIEVPLDDGTNVHIKGYYEEYGYVRVKLDGVRYEFYLQEFEDYFRGWISDKPEKERSTYFLATKCWTYKEEHDDGGRKVLRECFEGHIEKFTVDMLCKCIRIDKDMGLPHDEKLFEKGLVELQEKMDNLGRLIDDMKKSLLILSSTEENQL